MDIERALQINDLVTRLDATESLLIRMGDAVLPTKVYAGGMKDVLRAFELYDEMSLSAQKTHANQMMPLVDRGLYYIRRWTLLSPAEDRAEEIARQDFTATVTRLKARIEQLEKGKDFALSVIRQPEKYCPAYLSETDKNNQRDLALDALGPTLGTTIDHRVQSMKLHRLQFLLHALPPDLAELANRVDEHVMTVHSTLLYMTPGSGLDLTGKHETAKRIWSHLERLGNVVDHFAVQSTAMCQADESSLWTDALAFVESINAFAATSSAAMDVFDELYRARSQTSARDDWAVEEYMPRAEPERARQSSGRGRGSRSRKAGRGQSAASSTQVDLAKDARNSALKNANNALSSSRLTMDLAMRFDADPLAIARELKHDTGAVELMESDGDDPLSIAAVLRSSAVSWFGSPRALSASLNELKPVADANPDDDEIRETLAKLVDRLDAAKLVNRSLIAREADSLKHHQFPKAQHLERMLQIDQIPGVSPPVRLPSSGDEGERGRLFELKITPRPLSDGGEAPAMYLHLHTNRPISAAQCLALPFGEFAAAHVKTERQRTLGPRWEEIQRQYGNDEARVHRGPVNELLLNALREKAKVRGSHGKVKTKA